MADPDSTSAQTEAPAEPPESSAAASADVDDVSWALPGARNAPAQALRRIRALCEGHGDLFSAMFAVAATHPGVAREILAQAIKQFRPDAEAYSAADMVSLLVSINTGGRDAFEAVQRTRKNAGRKASALPWGSDKD
jgi:hypothetical protein